MIRADQAVLAAVAFAYGCNSFNPLYDEPKCGPVGECPDGLFCTLGTCRPQTCGDGVIVGSEVCDDGNLDGADGCDAACTAATCFVPVTHPSLAAGLADPACFTLYVYSGIYLERITVSRNVTVVAVGTEPVILDGEAGGTVITVEAGATATLRGFTIRNGQAPAGGGIVNRGTLTLDAMTIRENVATAPSPAGGGIDNAGSLTLTASVVTRNRLTSTATPSMTMSTLLSGAGIRSTAGTARLEKASSVEANEIIATAFPGADARGAGIYAQNTIVKISDASWIRGNVIDVDGRPGRASAQGGGLWQAGGMLTIDGESAIEGNLATARGGASSGSGGTGASGGGFAASSAQITLYAAFVRDNQVVAIGDDFVTASGGGGHVDRGSLAITGTELTGNTVRAESLGSMMFSAFAFATAGGLSIDGSGSMIADSKLSSNAVSATTSSATANGRAVAGAVYAETFGSSQTVTFLRCTFDGNLASSSDIADTGALYARLGTGSGTVLTVNVVQSTISNNVASGRSAEAGGAHGDAGTGDTTVNLNFVNSTVSGNRAEAPMGSAQAGGIEGTTGTGSAKVNVNLASSTITGNSATGMTARRGGLYVETGISASMTTASFKNTILAGNSAPTDPDCGSTGAPTMSGGYNLIGSSGSCTITGTTTGNRSGDAGLGPLGDNGGPTKTHALLPGSQAIDAVNATCTDLAGATLTTDQRSLPRVRNGRCDIGAFEL